MISNRQKGGGQKSALVGENLTEVALRSSPIVGAFVFPDFWENPLRAKSKLAHLRAAASTRIMTESDSYQPAFRRWTRCTKRVSASLRVLPVSPTTPPTLAAC